MLIILIVQELEQGFNKLNVNNFELKKEKAELEAKLAAQKAEKAALEKQMAKQLNETTKVENELKKKIVSIEDKHREDASVYFAMYCTLTFLTETNYFW